MRDLAHARGLLCVLTVQAVCGNGDLVQMSETIAAEAYRPRIMAAITHERHRLRLAAGRSSPDLKVVKDAVHNLRRLADRAHLTGLATVSGLIAARLRTIETGDAPSSILPALALAADQSITMAIIEA